MDFWVSVENLVEKVSIDEVFVDLVIVGFVIQVELDGVVVIDYIDQLFSDIYGIVERLKSRKQGMFKVDLKCSGVYLL